MHPRLFIHLITPALLVLILQHGITAQRVEAATDQQYKVLMPKSLNAQDGSTYRGDLTQGFSKWSQDGTLEWSKNMGVVYAKPVEGSDGSLYVSSSNGRIYSLSTSGQVNWQLKSLGPYYYAPVLSHNEKILFGVTQNGWLNAVNVENGESLWTLNLGFSVNSSLQSYPVLAPDQAGVDALYITDSQNKLYAVDLNAKTLSWVRTVGQ
jgi:outer membrane protein assembly factor BamB